jgi:UDP-N-acetylmuramoylalanine-D-glutamate ligase
MNYFLAVLLGKTLRGLIRGVRRGGGSALPGLVVSKIWPNFLCDAISSLTQGLVIVSGSAGKSSTTQMIVRLLEMHGLRVFTNRSTANIQQGLLSAVLEQANFSGKLAADIAVLEVDEGHLRSLLQLKPRLAVLTNVLSDQLDRFNDPSRVIARLAEVSKQVEKVVINGDDPNLNQLPFSKMPLVAGLSASLLKSKSAPRYAFNFRKPVAFERDISVFASNGFELRMGERKLRTASSNSQHALNDALAVLAAGQILELNYDFVEAELLSGKRVFARNETVVLNDKRVNLRLVQNPTSFQLNLDELTGEETPLMMMAGADIHDPSWLWTVDFQKIKKVDIVAGSNAYDLALRLHFAGVGVGQVITDPGLAADKFLEIKGGSHTILFSADAMRRTRRHLGLAK